MSVTIHDLARLAGLNPSTVSRALRDDPRIKPATREKIRQLAVHYGYVANRSARSLATGRTRTLALLLGDLQNDVELSPARFADAAGAARGYHLAVLIHGGRRFGEQLTLLGQKCYDGAILFPPGEERRTPEILRQLKSLSVPALFTDRHWEGTTLPVVTTAEAGAIAALVDAVLAARANAAYVWFPSENTVARARKECARKSLAAAHIPYAETPEELAALLRRQPGAKLAVFADSPWSLPELPQLYGAAPPERLFGAMFDSWKYTAPDWFDRIFLCIQDFEAMGRRCADLLIDQIENGEAWAPGLRIEIPHREIIEVM